MTSPVESLRRAARQLLDTDRMLGGDFVPVRPSPLPEIRRPAAQPAAGLAPAAATPGPDAPQIDAPELPAGEKGGALEAFAADVAACKSCALAATRNRPVPGEGDPNASLVFVGEAPGAEEDAQGRPFVGRAGELLTRMINAMGLSRDVVYICNMLKCRPPNNRTPNPQETECCWGFLVRQLQIIRPEVIVTLGNPATKGLLGTKIGITKMRGNWQKLPEIGAGLGGIDVMPTFHPAYLLRQYTPDNRGKVWADLQKVMDRLGLKKS
jgi:DNA polymerase